MFVRRSELDVFHTSVRVDLDRGGPAPYAITSGHLLLEVLHERIRQAQALANVVDRLAVGAAVEGDDEGRRA